MVIGAVSLRLHIPGAQSLKDKRRVVKSILARLQNTFNVSAAEVEDMDKWQVAILGMVTVSNDSQHANEVMSKAVDFIEGGHWDAEVLDYELEILHVL